jgi:chemotaxis protein histidine kinase CheA
MCQGRGHAAEALAAAEVEAAAAAAAEATALAAAEAAVRMRRAAAAAAAAEAAVRMRRAAALLLADVRGLSHLIALTQESRAKLASAIDRLHEAAQELQLPLSDAGRIMAPLPDFAGVFQGPVPGPIDTARRIVGDLCCIHILLPVDYLVYDRAFSLLFRCAEMLDFSADRPPWQRWRGRMHDASFQSTEAGRSLFDADDRAMIAYEDLFNFLEVWYEDGAARMDRARELSSAEENLHGAMDLMDQALTAMRRMQDALELQAYELMILARN